jgi:glycosyltransferase involved in cell wall biosynthesis
MSRHRIAIVLPTHNRLGMLKRTLRSLARQTFKDFIVYISDDASTDDTRLLGSADFPNLDVQILRRLTSYPTLQDHFTALFYSVKEEIVVMAHDDEVYHPELLARLAACLDQPEVVFAYGQTVYVDAKTKDHRFYIGPGAVPEGTFTGLQLREGVLEGAIFLPANGFAVRTSALVGVPGFPTSYEQFDYEWMMRVADQGLTRMLPDYLASYTVHASNTVGSPKYLKRFLNQRSSDQMREEWLAQLPALDPARRAAIAERLSAGQANLEWRMFLKATGYGETDLARTYGERYLVHEKAQGLQKLAVRMALAPGLSSLATKLVGAAYRRQAGKPVNPTPGMKLVPEAEAVRMFPTLALFSEPL